MFRPKGSFRYAGKGPIVLVFVNIDECDVGVVGATLLVGVSNCGFSIPVMDWFSLVCKDIDCWFIGAMLPKFMEVNFGKCLKFKNHLETSRLPRLDNHVDYHTDLCDANVNVLGVVSASRKPPEALDIYLELLDPYRNCRVPWLYHPNST